MNNDEKLWEGAARALTFANRIRRLVAKPISDCLAEIVRNGDVENEEVREAIFYQHKPLPEISDATKRYNLYKEIDQSAVELQNWIEVMMGDRDEL